jgi:type I restriction enzyme M protein
MAKGNTQKPSNSSALDFEAQLWAAADKMRGHMDASEYKHVCLGLIFLKYISDAFEEKREQLLLAFADPKSDWFIKDEPQRAEAAENRDEYLAANVFWLPPEARWHNIKAKAKSPEIGKVIDEAMIAIERENPTLKGVLPRDYARPSLDKVRLGGLVDIISNIGFNESPAKSKDVLGRVYEYFLAPWERVPAPAFGGSVQGSPTGRGKFVSAEGTLQSANTSEDNRRVNRDFSLSASIGERAGVRCRNFGINRRGVQNLRGQRWPCASTTTWKLARMNLAIRGIEANLSANLNGQNSDNFRRLLLQ